MLRTRKRWRGRGRAEPLVTEAEGYKLQLSNKAATGYYGVSLDKKTNKVQGSVSQGGGTVTSACSIMPSMRRWLSLRPERTSYCGGAACEGEERARE